MSIKDMMSNWVVNNTRLVKKQTSIRLPVHVAAKIEALCEMYPVKTKNEIITDLLTGSLDEVYDSFDFVPGEKILLDGEECYMDSGIRTRYTALANKHFHRLEVELGNPEHSKLFHGDITTSCVDYEAQQEQQY